MANGLPAARPNFLPWRSARLGAAVAVALFVAGLPPFLRMPPWADLTLYDVAAASLLRGGVLYRDVFDTNLPGFVWLLAVVRSLLGWSYEAVRLVDLGIVAGIGVVLDRFARDGGAGPAVRAWTWAAFAAFYPFLTEACHGQRDVWMLLPALLAVRLRWKLHAAEGPISGGRVFRSGVLQGLCWGAAVWIKPHVVVPAAVVWLGTAFVARHRRSGKIVLTDLIGNMLGGGALGLAGVGYLNATGTWSFFLDVLTNWNPSYIADIFSEAGFRRRAREQDAYFPPWSYLHWLAVPVAFATALDGLTGWVSRSAPWWLWTAAADRRQLLARLFPAVLYLGWTLQAVGMQRGFHYVHVPEVLLMLWLLAAQRWAVAFAGLVTTFVVSGLVVAGWFDNRAGMFPGVMIAHDPRIAGRHPTTTPEFWRKWPSCWRMGLGERENGARMWSLSRVGGFDPAPNWVELGEVADELRRRGGAGDGDLIAWNDSPHALYLMLKIRPGLRYIHLRTALSIGDDQETQIYADAEAAAVRARFAVTDLKCLWHSHRPYDRSEMVGVPDPGGQSETGIVIMPPPGFDLGKGLVFPFNRPAVFRSCNGAGRYLIHDLHPPAGQ